MTFDFSLYSVLEVSLAEEHLKSHVKDTLLKLSPEEVSAQERVKLVEGITESFFEHFGKFPSSVILYHLSNFILLDDISSKLSNKSKQDNAFLSPRQIVSRNKNEFLVNSDVIDIAHSRRVHNIATPKFTGNLDDV